MRTCLSKKKQNIMAIKLRDYQLAAIKQMKNGCVLCGGVGSGKSITAIGYYYMCNNGSIDSLMGKRYIKMRSDLSDLYIITTARKRDTFEWDKELVPFLLNTDPKITPYKNKVIIDSWNNISKYKDVEKAFFIFDEQRVVGSGVWVKSFIKIAKHNKWILLSATPGDTWSDYIPLFIANGFYKNRSEFIRDHVIYSRFTKFPKIDRYVGEQKLKQLRDSILIGMDFNRPTIPHHSELFCTYDIPSYKSIMKNRWDPWKNEPIENAGGLCYALRKIVNVSEDRQRTILEVADKHPKIIVFYNFDYELDILKNIAWPKNTVVCEWNGHKHEPIPNSNKWVYLVNYSAGAEGWNCILTDTMVFYSQNYSYRIMAQACGRIDRMNTPFVDLYYYHLKSRSGIDIAIARAIRAKKTFNEKTFITM